ncbi:Hypothetical_protein [Hexamita inflata]|uniref:Hypothetical_protein n=1 Tax=Hexamita inflata TaxID=28002 RepID=A0AA86NY94_9EUKA|nr:Hypothetical protein HINF_LOCUS15005 [Hexamita inflata]
MQTIRPADKEEFDILINQLDTSTFTAKNAINRSIILFFQDKTQQLPDLDQDQIDTILKYTEDSPRKVIREFRETVIKFNNIIKNYKDSKYQIKLNDQIITLQRMQNKQFINLYNNFTKDKTYSQKFYSTLDIFNPIDISIYELKLLIATYDKETQNKKRLIQYLKFIEDHMIQEKKKSDTTLEYFIKNINSKEPEVINKCFDFIKNNDRFEVQTKCENDIENVQNVKRLNVITKFIQILQMCQYYHSIRVLIDPELYSVSQKLIPILIMKSFQIYQCYPDSHKIVYSQIFNFNIPICYTSTIDAEPLFINDIQKQDIHLTKNGISLHKQILQSQNNNNIIHHKNFNQFDNNIENLFEVRPDDLNSSHQKHMKLHAIGCQDYKEKYFRNYIDIIEYTKNKSFYKHYMEKTPDDNKRLEYLFNSTFLEQPVSYTIEELIHEIKYQIRLQKFIKEYNDIQPDISLQNYLDLKLNMF